MNGAAIALTLSICSDWVSKLVGVFSCGTVRGARCVICSGRSVAAVLNALHSGDHVSKWADIRTRYMPLSEESGHRRPRAAK
jgi:hypothetical protein